jgi:hypothetical protein
MPVIAALVAIWLLWKVWWLLAALAAVLVLGWAVGKLWARHDDNATARRRRDAEICARADRQHAAILAGDELCGVYGEWPPAGISHDYPFGAA